MQRVPKELQHPQRPVPYFMKEPVKPWSTKKRWLALGISSFFIAAFAWGSLELCMWQMSKRKVPEPSAGQNIVRVIKPKLPVDSQKPKRQKDETQKYFD